MLVFKVKDLDFQKYTTVFPKMLLIPTNFSEFFSLSFCNSLRFYKITRWRKMISCRWFLLQTSVLQSALWIRRPAPRRWTFRKRSMLASLSQSHRRTYPEFPPKIWITQRCFFVWSRRKHKFKVFARNPKKTVGNVSPFLVASTSLRDKGAKDWN